jgi:LysM repeat protein
MMKMTRCLGVMCCFLLVLLLSTASSAQSRKDSLLIVPAREGMYFYHVVAPKETLYSLSREYDVDVHKLAAFNHMDLHSRLKLYQLVRIPLTQSNFSQTTTTPGSFRPLYHKVTRRETLYHIGRLYNDVSLGLLRKWNHLKGSEVRVGQFIVVGWLGAAAGPAVASAGDSDSGSLAKAAVPEKKPGQAPPRTSANPAPAPRTSASVPPPGTTSSADGSGGAFLNEVIAAENENRKSHAAGPHRMDASSAASGDDAFTVKVSSDPKQEAQSATKPVSEEKPRTVQVKETTPLSPPAPRTDSFALMLNRVTHRPRKASSKPVTGIPGGQVSVPGAPDRNSPAGEPSAEQPVSSATAAPATLPAAVASPADSLGAAVATSRFLQQYEEQTAGETRISARKGAAGWFHSNVKPGSGTYYALCNDLPRGTIVKVVNPLNRHSVLVKVLDVIPRSKENYNLIIKLSDAAKGDLDVGQSRFWCKIVYPDVKKAG